MRHGAPVAWRPVGDPGLPDNGVAVERAPVVGVARVAAVIAHHEILVRSKGPGADGKAPGLLDVRLGQRLAALAAADLALADLDGVAGDFHPLARQADHA